MTEFTAEWKERARQIVGTDNASPDGDIAFQCLDHIERQAQRIEELEQERRWIPISSYNLPNEMEEVFVYDIRTERINSFVFSKPLINMFKKYTHWMKFVTPPEGDGE